MFPSTLTLLVAASSLLSANAAPIFSGFFASPAPRAPAPAAIEQRDLNLTGAQLAQGTNAFFKTLLLEAVCTPGQVGCINNNTATCSGEGNWEITPCTGNSTCLAIPASTDPTDEDLIVQCIDPSVALTDIELAGGSPDLAVDYSITTAPFNTTATNTTTPDDGSDDPTDGGDQPTATETFSGNVTATATDAPTATCTGDDGDDNGDDGSDDGSDDGPNDGSDNGLTDTTIPSFTQSLGGDIPVPTATDASSDNSTATATCTPEAEPTETEYITVIAFPDPTDSNEFSYSTVEPTETLSGDVPAATDGSDPTDGTTATDSFPTDTSGSDADVPQPTDTYMMNGTVPCVAPGAVQPTSNGTDTITTPDATTTATDGAPTTISIPPNFSISGPVPDINTIGTFEIPITTSAPAPVRRGMRKVRRS